MRVALLSDTKTYQVAGLGMVLIFLSFFVTWVTMLLDFETISSCWTWYCTVFFLYFQPDRTMRAASYQTLKQHQVDGLGRSNESVREFKEKTFTDSPVSRAPPTDSSFDSVDDGPCFGLPENTEINVPVKVSSPLRCNVSAYFCSSTIREDQSSFPTFLPNDVVDTTKIFEGSQITVSDASTITDLFCIRYKFSDDCSTDLLSLIKNLLPVNNNFPTGYSFIKKVKTNFENSARILEKSSENSFCFLNFCFQIRDIIKRHFFQFYSTLISVNLMKRKIFLQVSVPFSKSIRGKFPP